MEQKNNLSGKARRQMAARAVIGSLAMFGLLFLGAGTWDYWQAWVYIISGMVIMLLMWTVLTPDKRLIEERLNPKQGVKSWDKVYMAVTTPMYILALLIAGLDVRFGWTTDMPVRVYAAGLAVYLIGQAIFQWSRYTNNFFSSMVRIQTDRGQTVCKEGPYRIIRHPGYLGGFLYTITLGIVLGSWWASIPQVIAGAMLIWRTVREDLTMQEELPGYLEYTQETRYRLIPGIW